MDHQTDRPTLVIQASQEQYEIPELQLVGHAADVVLGFPGVGPDGWVGASDWDFEFKADAPEDRR
jgi:hypothetical protein